MSKNFTLMSLNFGISSYKSHKFPQLVLQSLLLALKGNPQVKYEKTGFQ